MESHRLHVYAGGRTRDTTRAGTAAALGAPRDSGGCGCGPAHARARGTQGPGARPERGGPKGRLTTLGQACPPECQGAQCAFEDSMIH